MNKNDLVGQVAQDTGLSKVDAARAVDSVFDNIAGSLRNKGEVRLVGFGTFSVSHRKATTGRNPRTGEAIQISASNQPKFKAGKARKGAANEVFFQGIGHLCDGRCFFLHFPNRCVRTQLLWGG